MTKEEFHSLASKGVVLLDGAVGSNMRLSGMPVGVSSERWIMDHPQVFLNLQHAYMNAGSRIVYAPTFAANRIGLRHFGLEDQIVEINTALVRLSKSAAGDQVFVAGDMTTTGQPLEPLGTMTYPMLYDIYREQAHILAEAGSDLLVAETMMGVEETAAALDAAQSVCDLPVMCTLSVEADGKAPFGGDAAEAVMTLQEMGASAVGVNCSVGPDQLRAVVASMKSVARVPIIAKPNAGMPAINEQGQAVYSMGPEEFARSITRLVDAGAGIVGGCCGTTPEYIRKIRDLLGHDSEH